MPNAESIHHSSADGSDGSHPTAHALYVGDSRMRLVHIALPVAGVLLVTGITIAFLGWHQRAPKSAQPFPQTIPGRIPSQGADASVLESSARAVASIDRRSSKERQVSVPVGDAAQVVAALRPIAEAGDARAALAIYLKLYECSHLPTIDSIGATAETLEKARASGTAYIADEARKRSECASVGDLPESRGRWLERAAELGNVQARLAYSSDPKGLLGEEQEMIRNPESVTRYKRKALGYLDDLARRGNVTAMLYLAADYNTGIFVSADPIKSYAYYRLAARAAPGIVPDELLRSAARKIPVGRSADAEAMASDLYAACCGRQIR